MKLLLDGKEVKDIMNKGCVMSEISENRMQVIDSEQFRPELIEAAQSRAWLPYEIRNALGTAVEKGQMRVESEMRVYTNNGIEHHVTFRTAPE